MLLFYLIQYVKFLIIQTAFIGDVILATSVVEKLRKHYPDATIDFLLRKGNESLLDNNPGIRDVLIWDKKKGKYLNLIRMIKKIRKNSYDYVINVHRFFSSGILTVLSGAKNKIGFSKNPLSFLFTKKFPHIIGNMEHPVHEVDRVLSLVSEMTDSTRIGPKLYPGVEDYKKMECNEPYICIAPSSVWFTKQVPAQKWIQFLDRVPGNIKVFLLGSRNDVPVCREIKASTSHGNVEILAGNLTFLESAALMQKAGMNYVNDSAPLHIASAVNGPCTAIFCSTIPEFGFGPLSDNSHIIEIEEELLCRPCGLHGKKKCPEGHFKCADINISRLLGLWGRVEV